MGLQERLAWATTIGYGLGDFLNGRPFLSDVVKGFQNPNEPLSTKITHDGAHMTVMAILTGTAAVIGTGIFSSIDRRFINRDIERSSQEAQAGIIPVGARDRHASKPTILSNGSLW